MPDLINPDLMETLLANGRVATASAPPADPYRQAVEELLQTTSKPKKLRPIDYLLQFAVPAAQAVGAAMSVPRYRANRAFYGQLLSGGVGSLAEFAQRKERDRESRRREILENILAASQINRLRPQAEKPDPLDVLQVQDPKDPGKTIFIDKRTQKPIDYRPPQKEAEDQFTFEQRTLPSGDSALYRINKKSGSALPVEVTEPIPGTQGKQPGEPTLIRPGEPTARSVPFITKRAPVEKPEKPQRQLREGAGGQYYWIIEGQKPQPTGVFNPQRRQEREGDIRRGQEQEDAAAAFDLVAQAYKELGEQADPKKVSERAKSLFRSYAGKSNELKKRSVAVSSAIEKLTRSANSADELGQILQAIGQGGSNQ